MAGRRHLRGDTLRKTRLLDERSAFEIFPLRPQVLQLRLLARQYFQVLVSLCTDCGRQLKISGE